MSSKVVDWIKLVLGFVAAVSVLFLFGTAGSLQLDKITEMTCLIRCIIGFAVLFCSVEGCKALSRSQDREVERRRYLEERRAERRAIRELELAQYEKEMRELEKYLA